MYVKEMGKSLPASLLAALLPAPSFLANLDNSLQEEDEATDLLKRFEEDIRCFKCDVCGLTFLGNTKLRDHMESTHRPDFQSSRPAPALPSLGDYLSSLENKIEHCTKLISEQSALIGKLITLQKSKSESSNSTTSATKEKLPSVIDIEDDLSNQFKCNHCPYETDRNSQLNLHISVKHNKEPTLVNCPLCSYNNASETEVTKHVHKHHRDTRDQFKCNYCPFETDHNSQLNLHISGKHSKVINLVECPLCSYKNESEPEVTRHVQNCHPDTVSCNKCDKQFESEDALKRHKEADHFKCAECKQDFSNKSDHNKHVAERHSKEVTGWSLLVGDSHVKSIKSRQIEKVLKGNRLRNPAASSPREGSG